MAFSPDSKTLASASGDYTVMLWDVATGKNTASLEGHTKRVVSVAFSPDGKTLASGSGDNTIRLWDVPAALPVDRRTEPARSMVLSPRNQDALWRTLSEEDAAQAYEAMRTLGAAPRQTIPLLKERLQAVPQVNIQRLIDDLDSGQFTVRVRARDELQRLSDGAEPALRQKLADKPSLEVCRQIEQLLTKIENLQLQPEMLRSMRAIELLEHLGSSEARQVLETLAAGAECAPLTREAKATLERLARRPVEKRK